MKLQLTLEYDGTDFSGWQRQSAGEGGGVPRTVQGEVERALEVILGSLAKRQGISPPPAVPVLTVSGRTDTGVHARGQVASFVWPDDLAIEAERLKAALNGITPPDLSICSVQVREEGFDARLTPHLKCYTYHLLLRPTDSSLSRRFAWSIPPKVDVAAMVKAARLFAGQHDFSSFRAVDCQAKSTVRTLIRSELTRTSPEELVLTVYGTGFLKQMIRIMTGTLVDVGLGRLQPADIPRIIAAQTRPAAGPTAPPQGLFLEWVRYLERPYYGAEL